MRVFCNYSYFPFCIPEFTFYLIITYMYIKKIYHPDVYIRLKRAKEFMDDCLSGPVDLDKISDIAAFSRFHFLRLFKDIYGITPHQYLTERRIIRAKELLIAKDTSVTDVCFEVGFQSVGSFSSLFQKTTGFSPLSYRTRILIPPEFIAKRFIPACFYINLQLQK